MYKAHRPHRAAPAAASQQCVATSSPAASTRAPLHPKSKPPARRTPPSDRRRQQPSGAQLQPPVHREPHAATMVQLHSYGGSAPLTTLNPGTAGVFSRVQALAVGPRSSAIAGASAGSASLGSSPALGGYMARLRGEAAAAAPLPAPGRRAAVARWRAPMLAPHLRHPTPFRPRAQRPRPPGPSTPRTSTSPLPPLPPSPRSAPPSRRASLRCCPTRARRRWAAASPAWRPWASRCCR
jgi:hypothetical protein